MGLPSGDDNSGDLCVGRIVYRELTALSTQIVNPKGEMKGSAITGPVGKEAAELWPVRGLHC